jgi:hypothetical protein
MLAAVARADTIVLKNNLVIRGRVVAETDENITIEHAFGRTVIPRKDVLRIEKEKTQFESLLDRLSSHAYGFERSISPELSPGMRNRLKAILEKYPNHAEARRELGYLRRGDAWVHPETREWIAVPEAPVPVQDEKTVKELSEAESLLKEAQDCLQKGRYRQAGEKLREIARRFTGTGFARKAAEFLEPGAALAVKQVEINGPSSNRIDVVFVAEGYTNIYENRSDLNADGIISSNEQAKFDRDVREILSSFVSEPPFSDYRHYFNFHQINVASRQVGADTKWKKPVRVRDTAFSAAHPYSNAARLLTVDTHAVKRFVSRHVPFDVIIVLVNDAWGGSGTRRVATIGINRYETEAGKATWNFKHVRAQAVHEFGHAFASLGDEYAYSGVSLDPVLAEREPPFPNVTRETRREHIKWRHWIKPETPIPTRGIGGWVGLYEGAFYHKKDYYRPQANCRMRETFRPFCKICREAIVLKVYRNVKLIESATPAEANAKISPEGSHTFSIKSPAGVNSSVKVDWTLDGEPLPGPVPFSRTLSGKSLSAGRHLLKVSLKDETEYVLRDPDGRMSASREWEVTAGEE